MNVDLFGDVSRADTGDRDAFDFYETPAWMTRSLLHFAPDIKGTTVLECCSGRDAIARVLREEGGCTVFTNDMDPRHPSETHADATEALYWRATAPQVDWVITNPPFKTAFDIVVHAVQHARLGVAFVLRKTWAEPTEDRGLWLFEHTPTREVREPRHSFRGEGSDSCASDWLIWDADRIPRRSFIDHLAKTRRRLDG